MSKYIKPKSPARIMVSPERHAALSKEAAERKMDVQDVAEEKFLQAEKK